MAFSRRKGRLTRIEIMQNSEVARMFDDYADILEIQAANPFRVRAYRNAARTLGDLAESLADIVADPERKLDELQGIGKDLAVKIDVIIKTGQFPQLEEARREIPAGVVEMLRIGGLGPKKVATLFKELSIQSLDELRQAAQAGQIAKLKGFGKKTQDSILAGIDQASASSKRFLLGEVKPEADAVVADLLKLKSVTQATLAGSGRRLKETVGDLDVLATAKDSAEAMDQLAAHPLVERVLGPWRHEAARAACARGSRWICVLCPTSPTARPCNISPVRRNTTS